VDSPPPPPEPQRLDEARLEWQIVHLSNRFSVRKKAIAVRASMMRADGSEANATLLTLSLLGRLMEAGYGPLQDLSTADRVQVEVERGLGAARIKYVGTLADVTPIASPLRAEYVLTVSLLVAPAPGKMRTSRFTVDADAMTAYRTAYDEYAARGKQALEQLDAAYKAYESTFEAAKAEYEQRGGGYASFPIKASGQVAVEGREKVAEDYASLRKALVQALGSAVVPADHEKSVANKSETKSSMEHRMLATATISEQGSNRIVWLALADQIVADEEAGAAALIEQLATVVEKKGAQ
jgi:hypothetical protein